jgi:hypothetical protein
VWPQVVRATRWRTDVLVVGAGLSGLAAARDLLAAGAKVVLLEAASRSGGRTRVAQLGGKVAVEEGAMWIHGWQGNPLTALAQAAGAARRPFDWEDDQTFVGPGRVMDRAQVVAAGSLLQDALHFSSSWSEGLSRDVPLGNGLAKFARRQKLDDGAKAELAAEVHSSITLDYGAGPGELSAWWWDEGDEFGGGDSLVAGGLGQDCGVGQHDRAGGGLHLAFDCRMDGLCRGRAETVCRVVDHDDACRLACFLACALARKVLISPRPLRHPCRRRGATRAGLCVHRNRSRSSRIGHPW